MKRLTVLWVSILVLIGCGDTTAPNFVDTGNDSGNQDSESDQGADIEQSLPAPIYVYEDYLALATHLCTPDGDRSKKIFSLQFNSYHLIYHPVAYRNSEGQSIFVNERCEIWLSAPTIASSILQLPLYRQLTVENFARLLEHFRALEFGRFGRLGFTRILFGAPFLYFDLMGKEVALGLDYQQGYINQATGKLGPEAQDIPFADYELLALAVLQYRFWEDQELLADAVPYRGDRLWINVNFETFPNVFPDRLVQEWPLDAGPEEMEVVALDPVCSDEIFYVTGDQADKFRVLRDKVLAMEPMDSKGHWTIPMRFGDKKYYVEMVESVPLEDEYGWIPWRGVRMRDVSCQE